MRKQIKLATKVVFVSLPENEEQTFFENVMCYCFGLGVSSLDHHRREEIPVIFIIGQVLSRWDFIAINNSF